MEKNSKIYVAGHRGLVGSAILRYLKSNGYTNIIVRTHQELDLSNQVSVQSFFESEKPEYVFLAAARVGGILANNTYRADFIYQNLMIQNNVIEQSYMTHVKKLLFLGSTCIYPKYTDQPIKEEYLLQSPLEYSNEPYAIAKIAGIKMCESYNIQYGTNFISVMPTNLYGTHDNFDFHTSHVLPALLRKIYLASLLQQEKWDIIHKNISMEKEQAIQYLADRGVQKHSVEIWGTGRPRRDLLYSDDMVMACMYIMEKIDFSDTYTEHTTEMGSKEIRNTHINIGSGIDYSISELATIIKNIVGYKGDFIFNSAKPDGTLQKRADITKIQALGWRPKISLEEGITKTYQWYTKTML